MRCQCIFLQKMACFVLFKKFKKTQQKYTILILTSWVYYTPVHLKSEMSNPDVPYIVSVWAPISPEVTTKLFMGVPSK